MFIKRDLRKVPAILADDDDPCTCLKLSRRGAEFHGSTRILCEESNFPRLSKLERLSLYQCGLNRLTKIGNLADAPLEDLCLGRNELPAIPPEFGELRSVRRLWLDDNQLSAFPAPVLQLVNLTLLRLSGNHIPRIPRGIRALSQLVELAIDNNNLVELPEEVGRLTSLKRLVLRGNALTELPSSVCNLSELEVLQVASNKLEALPDGIGRLLHLTTLMINGNRISRLPAALGSMPALRKLNARNNAVERVPKALLVRWSRVFEGLDPVAITEVEDADEDVDMMAVAPSEPRVGSPGTSGGAGVGAGAGAGSGVASPPILASLAPRKPKAQTAGEVLDALTAHEDSPADLDVDVSLLGNPILAGHGAALTKEQYTQPLTATWKTKAKKKY